MQQLVAKPQDKGCLTRAICAGVAVFLTKGAVWGCDIALALAVDVSGSVDAGEYRLQMQGLADGLRDATVASALVAADARVLVVQWTGDSRQMVAVPWARVDSFAAAEALAVAVETAPRGWRNFSTAIGAALKFTAAQFGAVTGCARRVIDVSGDGASNEGIDPASLRHGLRAGGFTVNGLAIEGSEPDLTAYYRAHVMVGDKGFVMTANGFADYPARIRLKLLREVSQQMSMRAPAARVQLAAQ